MSGSAPGGSTQRVRPRDSSSMPFSIVPVLSKSEVIERSTQPDIWFSRSVSAFAAAIAPSVISPGRPQPDRDRRRGEDEDAN